MRKNWLKLAVLFFVCFLLVVLDTSFFSFLAIYDASVILSFLVICILVMKLSQSFHAISFFSIVFFTIFSSLPPYLIIILFLLLPSLVYYLRQNFLPEPSFAAAVVYFVSLTGIFGLALIVHSKEWTESGMLTLGYFIVINTFSGFFLYILSKKMQERFNRSDIKV